MANYGNNYEDDPEIEDERDMYASGQNKGYYGAGSNDNDVEGAGFLDDPLYRQLLWSGCLFFFSILAIGRMFSSIKAPDCDYEEWDKEYKTIIFGFILTGIGMVFILIGSLIAFIMSILKKQSLGIILFILLCFGGVCYIIGSWVVVGDTSYIHCGNNHGGQSDLYYVGHGSIIFGEFLLIGSLSILLGLDLWKDHIFSDFKKRMFAFCGCIALSSFVAFLGYAILGYYLSSVALDGVGWTTLNQSGNVVEHPNSNEDQSTGVLAGDMEFCAVGWCFTFLTIFIYLLAVAFKCLKKSIIYIICSLLIIGSTLVCAIAYWALNEFGNHAMNAYFIGMSFFLIGMGIILALDMSIGQYVNKYILKR